MEFQKRFEQIETFFKKLKFFPLDMNQSIQTNFIYCKKNFDLFKTLLFDIFQLMKDVSNKTDVNELTQQVYENMQSRSFEINLFINNFNNNYSGIFSNVEDEKLKVIIENDNPKELLVKMTRDIKNTDGTVTVVNQKLTTRQFIVREMDSGAVVHPLIVYPLEHNDEIVYMRFSTPVDKPVKIIVI